MHTCGRGESQRPCGVKAQRAAALQDAAGMAELQQQLDRLRSEASEADGNLTGALAAHIIFTASAAQVPHLRSRLAQLEVART